MGSQAAWLVLLISTLALISGSTQIDCKSEKCKCCSRSIKSSKALASNTGELATKRTNLNMQCLKFSWRITSPMRGKKIRLSIQDFTLARGDFVKIYDGMGKSQPLITAFTSGHVPREIVSSGQHMYVDLRTTCEVTERRFKAAFKTTDCGGLIVLKENKKETLKSPKGRFGDYPPNADCLWTVVPHLPDGAYVAKISYKVEAFQTESGSDNLNVFHSLDGNNDNVQLFSGDSGSDILKRLQTPGLVFRFTSDRNIQRKGFRIALRLSSNDDECPKPDSIINGGMYISNFSQRIDYWCCTGYNRKGATYKTCKQGAWSPEGEVSCQKAKLCEKPFSIRHGRIVSDSLDEYPIGKKLTIKCDTGYYQNGLQGKKTIKATCSCNGNWEYDPEVPNCKPVTCGEPPVEPQPNGEKNITDVVLLDGKYLWKTIVNYSCPDGYGLRGIPFRVCDSDGQWSTLSVSRREPFECIKDLAVCPDPGLPENSIRKAESFEDGAPVAFTCSPGYELIGSVSRTCHASESGEPFWDGNEAICKSKFKDPAEIAASLRENFLDRVIACKDALRSSDDGPSSSSSTVATPTSQTTDRTSLCSKGRSILVGRGCVDIAFAVDCSKSMQNKLFAKSIEFVKTVVNVFSGVEGDARFALLTYDDKAKVRFNFDSYSKGSEVIKAINSIDLKKSCWGATGTRDVLQKLNEKIFSTETRSERRECTKAAFLITDGYTNWGGSPERYAEQLRESNVSLYAFAIRDLKAKDSEAGANARADAGIESLKKIVKSESRVMEVVDISDVVKRVFDVTVDYAECGLVDASTCIQNRGRSVGGCQTRDGDWPWVVAIYLYRNGDSFICGGSIINDRTIMTAAHCISVHKAKSHELLVVVGDRLRRTDEKTERTFNVCKISIPGNYDPLVRPEFDHDIALLHLCCCIKFRPYARPVCLPQLGDESLYKSNVEGTVVGWGGTEKVTSKQRVHFSATQHQVELPVTDDAVCKAMDSEEVSENMFCAGDGKGKKDACNGDSGGPFVSQRKTDNELRRPYVATGIVSWGIGCAQENTYGAYTKVANYVDWIRNETEIYATDFICSKALCNPSSILV